MRRQFRVMGTTAEVITVGGAARLVEHAEARLRQLEAKWSRFLPTSELSRLNRLGGCPVVVSEETFAVVEHAVEAWWSTAGRFDPTVLPALVALGYDRSFDAAAMSTVHLDGDAEAGTDGPWFGGTNVPSRGCRDIGLDKTVPAVRLPRGVQLDLGGIGKGYAADLVAEELIELGADGVCVNLGGDLRVIGEAPTDAGWVVGLEHPFGGDVLGALQLAQGAIATSTRGKRHWERNGRPVHHLVDPTTGTPAWTGVASVTVVAGEAWRAEVLAKAVFVAGADAGPELLRAAGAGGLIVDDAGAMQRLHGLEEFLV